MNVERDRERERERKGTGPGVDRLIPHVHKSKSRVQST